MPLEITNRSRRVLEDQKLPLPTAQSSPVSQTPPPISAVEEVSNSWRRCMADYHVNPKDPSAPNVVTQSELSASKEPVADIIGHAREEIDRLYAIVRQQGYVVLLCNSSGVAIHHRGDETRADDFKRWGIWLGGVWSEQIEGTNGIGTCITEQRPLLVHCSQHFRSRHSKLTCAGAPIFDPLGNLAGVLDVSAVATEGPDRPAAARSRRQPSPPRPCRRRAPLPRNTSGSTNGSSPLCRPTTPRPPCSSPSTKTSASLGADLRRARRRSLSTTKLSPPANLSPLLFDYSPSAFPQARRTGLIQFCSPTQGATASGGH